MNILVTVDDNYVRPLRVMLDSFFRWNAKEKVTVYLFYAKVAQNLGITTITCIF